MREICNGGWYFEFVEYLGSMHVVVSTDGKATCRFSNTKSDKYVVLFLLFRSGGCLVTCHTKPAYWENAFATGNIATILNTPVNLESHSIRRLTFPARTPSWWQKMESERSDIYLSSAFHAIPTFVSKKYLLLLLLLLLRSSSDLGFGYHGPPSFPISGRLKNITCLYTNNTFDQRKFLFAFLWLFCPELDSAIPSVSIFFFCMICSWKRNCLIVVEEV